MGLLGGFESFQALEFLNFLPWIVSLVACSLAMPRLHSVFCTTHRLQHPLPVFLDLWFPSPGGIVAATSSDACHTDICPVYDIPRVSCMALCTSRSGPFLTEDKSHVPWSLEWLLRPSSHPRTTKNPGLTLLFHTAELYCLGPPQLNLRQGGGIRIGGDGFLLTPNF